jgi:hypothetical protein
MTMIGDGAKRSLIILPALLLITLPTPVRAGACAAASVIARGEESSFVWLAKTKARANWWRKVRSLPGLGPNYANWAHAENTEERCLSGPAGVICIFTGTPCFP